MIRRGFPAALLVVLAAAAPAPAGEEPAEEPVEELRRRMDAMEKRHEEEVRALREEIERLRGGKEALPRADLEEAIEEYLDRTEELEDRVDALSAPRPVVKLIDISLSGLFVAGGSTATEEELADLQGGGHDPHKRGFTVQNLELALTGAVDPYFRGDAFLITTIDPEGETTFELEEAYLTTTSLPAGLQVRAGHFFTEFGRINPSHPHSWEFVDQPVVNTRMFGPDGMRGPGARVSWLVPTEFPLEVLATAQNANGETMTSFLGTEEEDLVGGRPFAERSVRSLRDLVYTGRVRASFDLGEETVVMPGISSAFGPNGTGSSARTRVDGADLTVKWKPLANDHGFPFVEWQSEYMRRRYAADEFLQPGEPFFPHADLRDQGLYSQLTWGFARNWAVGARWDWAEGRGGDPGGDPLRDHRTRGSLALTWYPSEFSKLRLQVNRDRSASLGDEVSVWLQWEINLGPHGAHTF